MSILITYTDYGRVSPEYFLYYSRKNPSAYIDHACATESSLHSAT